MVVLGVDAHERTHTVVAADGNGRQLAHATVAATSAGHLGGVSLGGAVRRARLGFGGLSSPERRNTTARDRAQPGRVRLLRR
jgi:hypothetical protein